MEKRVYKSDAFGGEFTIHETGDVTFGSSLTPDQKNRLIRIIESFGEYTTRRPSPKEEEAVREQIVRDMCKAKRDLGLSQYSDMRRSFFKDLWPKIFRHLKMTGFKLDD